MRVVTCFLVIQLMLPYVYGSARLFAISARETRSCEQRRTPGLICETCSMMATCVQIDGEWKTIPVASCDEDRGLYCNVKEAGCSNKTGSCNPIGMRGNFVCNSEGVFPDPHDCQKYHMCYNTHDSTHVAFSVDCGTDRAFSAATGDCSESLSSAVCRNTQYNCNDLGETTAWPGNGNIFYVCMLLDSTAGSLHPSLFRCASGEVFNGRICVDENRTNEGGSETTLMTTEFSLTTSAITGTTMTQGSFRCTSAGLFPDPNSCYSYYYCNPVFTVTKLYCPLNSYFNRRTKACSVGLCIY